MEYSSKTGNSLLMQRRLRLFIIIIETSFRGSEATVGIPQTGNEASDNNFVGLPRPKGLAMTANLCGIAAEKAARRLAMTANH